MELLYLLQRRPEQIGRQWHGRAHEALNTQRLGLLAAAVGGGPSAHSPDFLSPQPVAYEGDLDAELHQAATTSQNRVGYEMTLVLEGGPYDSGLTVGRTSPLLRDAVERGEHQLTQRLTEQLEQFWNTVLAPHWSRIRAQLEGDIARRTDAIARDGFGTMINKIGSTASWRDGGLDIGLTHHHGDINATAVIFMPTVFGHTTIYHIDPDHAPERRHPMIVYPAVPSAGPPRPLDKLIGATRARVLAELATPHTTSELAAHMHLSPATVSYHLQVLHHAGLIIRTRRSRHVLYQQARQHLPHHETD